MPCVCRGKIQKQTIKRDARFIPDSSFFYAFSLPLFSLEKTLFASRPIPSVSFLSLAEKFSLTSPDADASNTPRNRAFFGVLPEAGSSEEIEEWGGGYVTNGEVEKSPPRVDSGQAPEFLEKMRRIRTGAGRRVGGGRNGGSCR